MTLNFVIPEFNIGGAGTPPLLFFRRGFNLGSSGSGPEWKNIILHGNTALTLVNSKANGLNYLKLFGGTEQRNLPVGYTQYEYLRSSGTQYIDLGYKGKGNTKVEIKFRYHTATSATGSGRIFGSRTTSSTDAFAVGTTTGVVASTGNKVFWCYDGQPYFIDDTEFGLNEWKTVVFSATEHTIDGVTVGDDYEVTEFETPYNLKLFGFDNNGTIGCGYVDIAYCKLWDDDGTLVRDVVPAYDGTTYSMYDKVSGTMLPNAGTGNFVAGSTAVPTPDNPIDIVSNNGVIKYGQYSNNIFNKDDTANMGNWYSSSSKIATAGSNATLVMRAIPNATYYYKHCSVTGGGRAFYTEVEDWTTGSDCSAMMNNTTIDKDEVKSITVSANAKWVFFNYGRSGQTATFEEQLADYMVSLTELTSATPYEPYHFGIHTDGTVETVEVTGKNLFNKNASYALFNGYLNNVTAGQNTLLNSFNGGDKTIIIKVAPNTTYTVARATNLGSVYDRIRCASFTMLPVDRSTGVMLCNYINATQASATFTTLSDTQYVAINIRNSGTVGDDWTQFVNVFQLEQGSTATDYEPYYNGGSATAEMLLKIGNYQDIQSVLDGKVTRNVEIKVLDGTGNWGSKDTYGRTQLPISNIAQGGSPRTIPALCTHYQNLHNGEPIAAVSSGQFYIATGGLYFHIPQATTADFETWLASQYANGTPVIVMYPLKEPTTETVTGQPLTIQAGTNVVEITQASIDNLELEVSYKAGVSVTVEEIENAQLDNSVEVTVNG